MDDFLSFAEALYFEFEGYVVLKTFAILIVVSFIRHFLTAFVSAWPVIFSNKHSIESLRLKGSKIANTGVRAVLASHNSGKEMVQTVLSLREQTAKRIQIIVVNDGSNDATERYAKALLKDKLIDNYVHIISRGGKAAAINAGLNYAKYPYTVFCDSGTTYHKDAIEIALGYFSDVDVGAVSCSVGVRNSEVNLLTYIQKLHYFISCTISRHALNFMGLQFVISGAFGLFRTKLVKALGGHSPGTGEDLDLTLRLRNLGWKIEFSFYSVALTDVPETLGELIKQTLRWDRDGIKLVYQTFAPYNLNPFLKKFDIRVALGFIDNFIVGCILPILVYVQMAYFILIRGEGLLFFLVTVYFLALIIELFLILISLLFVNRHDRDWHFLYFAPLYVLFKQFFYEPLRLIAIWSELVFRHSYQDNFSPPKVQNQLKRQRHHEDQ